MWRVLFLVFICSSSSNLFGQAEAGECLSMLQTGINNIAMSGRPSGNEVYFYQYSVKTIYRDKTVAPTNSTIKVYISKDQIQVHSSQATLYKDKEYVFAVVPSRKVIYMTKGSGDSESLSESDMARLQLEFVNRGKVLACKEVISEEGKYDKEMILEPCVEDVKLHRIKSLTYYLNSREKSIYKIILNYPAEAAVSKIEYTFSIMDHNYSKTGMSESLSNYFFSEGKKLSEKFAGYTLVDNIDSINRK